MLWLFLVYLCVCPVGSELVEYEWVEQAHVSGHLLHSPQLALLLCVGQLHHQARGGALKAKTRAKLNVHISRSKSYL